MTCIYVIGLIIDWPTWLRGSNWIWERHALDTLTWRNVWLLLVMVAGGILIFIAARKKLGRRQTALFLTGLIFFTVGVQIVVAAQHHPQPLAVPFWSSSAFFLEGVRITDPTEFLQNHVQAMPHYRDVHVRTQPPGWPLSFWAVSQLLERFPDWAEPMGQWFRRYDCLAFDLQGLRLTQIAATILSMSLLVVSGLGVLPAYWLGKRLFSQQIAQIGAVFYPFLPAYLAFQARSDVLYAVISLTSLWLLAEIMLNGRRWPIVVLSLLIGVGTFWGFGLVAVILLLNLFMLAYLAQSIFKPNRKTSPLSFLLHPVLTVNAAILLVLLLFWGTLWLKWDVNGLAMFQRSQELHQELRLSYPSWRWFNLYDTAVFMGIPLAVGCIVGIVYWLRRPIWQRNTPGQRAGRQLAFVFSWGLALLILNLSGQVRAETGRLWIFLFAPGLLVGVSGWCHHLLADTQKSKDKGTYGGLFVIFAVYMIQALAVGYFLGGRAPASPVPPVWSMPDTAVSLDYQLGEAIHLSGYETQIADNELHLTLYWQAVARPLEDYSVFVHLFGPKGTTLAQSDSRPKTGALPTWCWVPGEIVADEHILSLVSTQEIEQQGRLNVGLYNWRNGVRLPVVPTVANDAIQLPLLAR